VQSPILRDNPTMFPRINSATLRVFAKGALNTGIPLA